VPKARRIHTVEDFPPEIWGTNYVCPIVVKAATAPELQFAYLWAETYPKIDLWHQYPFMAPTNSLTKFDFAHIETKVGIEIHGGTQAGMGHNTGRGVKADALKQRRAAEHGWVYLALTSAECLDADKLALINSIITKKIHENKNAGSGDIIS